MHFAKDRTLAVEWLESREVPSITPDGSPSLVADYPTDGYDTQVVASDAAGNSVVVWQEGGELKARLYDDTGSAVGSAFTVHATSTDSRHHPSVAMDEDGDFVVVWLAGDYLPDVYARRFDSDGTPAGSEFQVAAAGTHALSEPSAAMSDDGQFVIGWIDFYMPPPEDFEEEYRVKGRAYDDTGAAAGSEFTAVTVEFPEQPSIGRVKTLAAAMDGDGDFVLVWGTFNAPKGDIYAREYGAAGGSTPSPSGSEFMVNTFTTGYQYDPTVSMSSAGDYVVAWSGQGPTGNEVSARLFGSNGGSQFTVVSAGTGEAVFRPSAAMRRDTGEFVIGWETRTTSNTWVSVSAQQYDDTGSAVGSAVELADDGAHAVQLAYAESGQLVATWLQPPVDPWDDTDLMIGWFDVT